MFRAISESLDVQNRGVLPLYGQSHFQSSQPTIALGLVQVSQTPFSRRLWWASEIDYAG
jgi:hypothetical protein